MSQGSKRNKRGNVKTDEEDVDLMDPGSWSCSVCTFRNRADLFHCLMCDTRKGTSTRKPKLNSAVVELQQTVQKIVQQQQQLQHQNTLTDSKEKHRDKAGCSKKAQSSTDVCDSAAVASSSTVSLPVSLNKVDCKSEPTINVSKDTSPVQPDENAQASIVDKERENKEETIVVGDTTYALNLNTARTFTVTSNEVTVVFTDYSVREMNSNISHSCKMKRDTTRERKSAMVKKEKRRRIKCGSEDSDSSGLQSRASE
ncbi:YY1-associated factor 2 [Trichinella pseudospiralis]|uniref:YY1-associated factor 2 n=2 Tax=Trichinella pseudospiralis TaxID=6337 RepID=A0A0V1DZG5_TRIPS|nr:YY1-associated factor 2 [Trichinella pseudospiralis]KRY66625.1 YY1-associated factor 2 [Trichinella pseudospiralis]KRY82739.1 YY1-associated factor 2 [Trichinella pseudospiralis]KRZ20346.1 YY1-associated factor 2 [Trichinella pseudospiralis]KRZ37692.1 YY1-associated factor 2 [Trichinella pseudospiralis]